MSEFLSPAFLPWWGWTLCALGAWCLCVISANVADEGDHAEGWVFAVISGGAGLLTTGLALIRFVKWAWVG